MVIAGKEDFGNNLSNFGKKFLWSGVLTNLGRALLRLRPNDMIIYYYSNYDELLPYHCYLPIYTHATCRYYLLLQYMYMQYIHYDIYMYMCIYMYEYVCVMLCYEVLCVACVLCTVLSCSVQPACLGRHRLARCLSVYIHIYSINYNTTLIIIVIIIHTIWYNYNYPMRILNMIFVYIILRHVNRLC